MKGSGVRVPPSALPRQPASRLASRACALPPYEVFTPPSGGVLGAPAARKWLGQALVTAAERGAGGLQRRYSRTAPATSSLHVGVQLHDGRRSRLGAKRVAGRVRQTACRGPP